MANEKINLKDTEISYWLVAGGLFTVVMIICEVLYKNIGGMFQGSDLWTGIFLIVLQVVIAIGWVITLLKWDDEAYDYWRKLVVVFCIGAICLVMGHRNGWLSQKQFNADVEKAKQEQTK